MTGAEALLRAHAAGLTLTPDPAGLRVRGPKRIRAALLPLLSPVVGEILRLLAPENRRAEASLDRVSSGALTEAAPARGSGTSAEPCSECGQTDWRVSLVGSAGERTCAACASGATALRNRGVPL